MLMLFMTAPVAVVLGGRQWQWHCCFVNSCCVNTSLWQLVDGYLHAG